MSFLISTTTYTGYSSNQTHVKAKYFPSCEQFVVILKQQCARKLQQLYDSITRLRRQVENAEKRNLQDENDKLKHTQQPTIAVVRNISLQHNDKQYM